MRLIDADALEEQFGISDADIIAKENIRTAPTIDAVPVVHGRWIGLEPEIGLFECNLCGHKILRATCNYCPNCGAKMDEVSE